MELDLTKPEQILYVDDIQDWNEHMDSYNYSASQRDIMRQCFEKKEHMFKFLQGKWDLYDTNKKENYEIFTSTSSNNIMSLKAVGIFDFPLMQMFATLHDARYRS